MARTKQTARRSTGGKPPRKHRKAEQEIARRQAAVKQAETMDVESDAESHCSSLSSAKSLGSPPPRDGPSEEQEGDAVTAAPEDEEEDATIKHEPRNSLPAPASTVTHSERPLDVPTFPATRKVDTTSTAQGEEMVEHEDGDEVEELGYFMSNIFAFRVPAAPRDEIGNWLPVSLYHCIGERSCDVYDSNMIKFGWLSIPNSSALWQLLVDTHSTKFRHNLELAARGSYGIEQIGDMSTRDLKAKITVFAAKRAAGHVLAELETQGVQIRRAGDGDVIVRSGPDLDEFDAETVAQKATSRLTQEDEFEPTHSPKSKATTDQVEPMVTESQPSEQRRDGEPVKILSTSPPLQASETTKGLSATDPIGDRAVQHGSHTATIRSAEDDIDPQGAAVIGTSTSTMSLEEASSAPAEASEAHQEEVPAMATPVETREERSPAQATAEGVQQTTLPAPPIIMEVQQEASLEQMLPAENRENAAVNGEALPSEVDASKHQQNIPPPQSTPAIEQEEMSSMIPPATPYDEEDVDDFLSFTHTKSKEVALQYLIAGGSLSKALRNFRKDQVAHKPTEQASQSLQDEAKPCTLIDEALDAYATMPAPTNRGRQDEGNTLVVLDGVNLGRNCRINFTDLYAAMPIAEARLTATDDGSLEVRGVRHLYFLLKPINGEMPKLERIRLSTTMEDCRDMIFTLPTASDDMESAGRSASGDETSGHTSQVPRGEPLQNFTDWQSGYEDFFCLLARFSPKSHNINDVNSTMPSLETVAQISNYYNAVGPHSPITDKINGLFLHYQLKETLWEAISADAARWLLLAIQLENGMIFKEAYIHIAGCYPAWPWSVSQSSFSTDLLESVEIKSSQLTDKRRQIDFKLMLLTIACSENPGDPSSSLLPASATLNSTTWIVVNIWRDWVVNHLAALEDDTDGRATPTALCTHPDDGECLTVAGFYRRIDQHQYLAPDVVLRDWNRVNFRHTDRSNWKECVEDNLHHLKNAARDLVAPLVETNTKFKGIVDYLTCVEFDEDEFPWGKKEVKSEEDGKDSVMGGVL